MRMRKKRNLIPRMEACSDIWIREPETRRKNRKQKAAKERRCVPYRDLIHLFCIRINNSGLHPANLIHRFAVPLPLKGKAGERQKGFPFRGSCQRS